MSQYCKVLKTLSYDMEFIAARTVYTDIKDVIKDDEKYGTLKPRNGKYFTFKIHDVADNEISEKTIIKAFKLAAKRWTIRANIDLRQAKTNEDADINVIWRRPANDERKVMTNGTIMYAYFPINDVNDPRRGLMVVNPDYYYTIHGRSLPMTVIDPDTPFPTSTIKTVDVDVVFGHELGHIFGLSHDTKNDSIMSTPYDAMNEYGSNRDELRIRAKYGEKKMPIWHYKRWFAWLRHRSENY